MKQLSTRKVVDAFIGEVWPTGDSHFDSQRLENFKELLKLVDSLMLTIEEIAVMRNYKEESVKKIATLAYEYRNRLTEYEQ